MTGASCFWHDLVKCAFYGILPQVLAQRSGNMHYVWKWTLMVLGTLFLALGIFGTFLPLVPAIPFFLLAAWCYAKSSPRLHRWLLQRPLIGNVIRKWHRDGGISCKTKIAVIACIWISTGISLLVFPISLLAKYLSIAFAAGVCLYILLHRRPISS